MNKTEYLLTCLVEECAEVQQAATKILRFGLDDCAPDTYVSNKAHLIRELIDVLAIVDILKETDIIPDLDDDTPTAHHMNEKIKKVRKYMNYSIDRGCLDAED